MRLRTLLLFLVVSTALISGCKGKGKGGGGKDDPLAGAGKKRPTSEDEPYQIAVIPKGLTHEHWQSVHRGAERAAADLKEKGIHVKVLWAGPRRESDASEQIGLIDQFLGQKIDGLVLAPQHSKQMVAPVERAYNRDVAVVIIDSNLDKQTLAQRPNLIVKYVATDNYHGGWLAGEQMLKAMDKDGKTAPRLVLLRYAVGSESTEQREKGFLDYIEEQIDARKKAGKPAPRLVSTDQYSGATVEEAEKVAGPLITTWQNEGGIDGMFAVNELATTAVVNALRAQKLNQKIKVIGFDSSRPLLQALRDGDVEAIVIQDPYRMGYLGVATAVAHIEGTDVRPGEPLSTGEYVVNRENMEREETRNKFDPELQKKRTIVPDWQKR